jgi:hypothetical protein
MTRSTNAIRPMSGPRDQKLLQTVVAVLFLQAAMVLVVPEADAQSCAGGVELWRELQSNGDLVIHCRKIDELTADEWRRLTPAAVAALSKDDRARLDLRRKALGIVLVVSPSQALTPETRDFYQRQVALLESKRLRAQRELRRISGSRQLINQGAIYNGQVINDLTTDCLSHSLNVLDGIIYVYGGKVPAETLEKIKAAISTAKVVAYAEATATSEPDSERQRQKLLETLNAMKALIPASVVGMDPQEWAAIKKATDTFPRMINISERVVNAPGDKSLWVALAESLDDFIGIASSLPMVGTPIKAMNSAATLVDSGVSLWYLKHDNYDLREASIGNQTARRYWVTRLGEIEQLQSLYKASLSGAGELNLEDLP